jgi:hypothetical protein
MSGFITKLGITTTGVTIETAGKAILQASARPVGQQISPLPVASFEEVLKGGAGEIPMLIRRHVQGVDFMLGSNGYVEDVVRQYLEALTQEASFKGFVLINTDRKLFGMIDGRMLLNSLTSPAPVLTFADFTSMLNRASPDDRIRLSKLPGFVPKNDAASPLDDKSAVLAKMERLGVDWWPVVNEQGAVEGYVERARLVASLILDVTDQLKASKANSAQQQ